MKLRVNNVVIVAQFPDTTFDLTYLKECLRQQIPWVDYDPWMFPALRVKEKYSALIYRNGKVIILGVKHLDVNEVCTWITQLLTPYVGELPEPNVTIGNIVATAQLDYRVDLDKLSEQPGVVYDPSVHPAASILFGDKQLLVFSSGKVILPGFKSLDDLFRALELVQEVTSLAKIDQTET